MEILMVHVRSKWDGFVIWGFSCINAQKEESDFTMTAVDF
jgi:hypothetical protein